MKGRVEQMKHLLLVSLFRQQGKQAVKAGGFECPFKPNLPIAIQEVIIIFVSERGWGSVMQEKQHRGENVIREAMRDLHGLKKTTTHLTPHSFIVVHC